jgi:hypothetical protein
LAAASSVAAIDANSETSRSISSNVRISDRSSHGSREPIEQLAADISAGR